MVRLEPLSEIEFLDLNKVRLEPLSKVLRMNRNLQYPHKRTVWREMKYPLFRCFVRLRVLLKREMGAWE